MTDHVALVALDEPLLARLLEVAVHDADPSEVMAPVAGPPGWTQARRDAFTAYHRSRRPVTTSRGETTYGVTVGTQVVGAARLAPVADDPGALEVGLWLGRPWRGRGIGGAVLPVAAEVARGLGAARLVAITTARNHAAVAALRRQGFSMTAGADGRVAASLSRVGVTRRGREEARPVAEGGSTT